MTEHEFYAQIQEDYFREFAGAELSEVFVVTDVHDEFFEFDDVPFQQYNYILNSTETILKGHMMTEKPVNYTPEQTAQLVANYKAGATVEALATMFGKTTRSVVAKLSREGVYQAKSKTSGVARVKKADLVDAIAYRVGVAPETFDSLEKANHEVLEAILANLR